VLVWCAAGAADAVAAALRAEAEGWARVLRVPLEDSGAVVRDL